MVNGWAGTEWLGLDGPESFAFDLTGCMAGPGFVGMNGWAGMGSIEWLGWDGPDIICV